MNLDEISEKNLSKFYKQIAVYFLLNFTIIQGSANRYFEQPAPGN